MSTKPQIELFLENENGSQQVAYPFVESDHVLLSNGMDIDTMIRQDVSMPTVAHEDLSFKVGVGDQDVSSAIVDSSVAEMTIKGKTYQNILPEPSTHVLTNNKEMFKVNEGLDPNVEIVDGVSKSAILSGKTLVNLCNASNRSETLTSSSRIFYCKIPYTIKANSVYTFFAKISNSTTSGQINLQYAHPDGTYSYPKIMDASTNGVVNTNIVNAKDITNILIYISNVDTGQVTVSDVMIIEGDYTNVNVPYFKGMQSVQMPVLTTTGKNLWNGEYENGYISPTDGYIPQTTDVRTTKWIKCKPNTTYICNSTSRNRWVLKGVNGVETVVGGVVGNETPTVTTLSDTTHLRCYYKLNGHTVENIQIEEGTSSTAYEPYKSNILSCELVPMNQSMFEQGTFSESTPPNTRPYEGIKVNSGNLYTTRIRTKGTYKVVKGATYSGQLNNGYGIFICYCKNGLYSAKDKGWIDETNFTFTVPNDCDEMFFALRKTDNSAITPSDYPLIGLKIHQEVVLRSLPNGVCDTLNLNTGEYVQRIGEIVLDGSQELINFYNHSAFSGASGYSVQCKLIDISSYNDYNLPCDKLICDKLKNLSHSVMDRTVQYGIALTQLNSINLLMIKLPYDYSPNPSLATFKEYLSQNPITVQYQLATPIIKTVDLSSSGNWEKIVLDGSEGWSKRGHGDGSTTISFHTPVNGTTHTLLFAEGIERSQSSNDGIEGYGFDSNQKNFFIELKRSRLTTVDVNGFKQYLQQNPITLWYQTTTHQDSTQVKQPIFFKDGHIVQSSGADNSLIPTLDYQAKTSNSYVMDLMKTNTKYTMKAKSASGTFTIDGTSYGAGTNDTFTTPSSMTNKFLVMSNNANEEIMILEGDVTDKTIPYFKGIKSAFEGEDKIEVLSTGKNLFDFNIATAHGGVKNKDSFSFNNIANIDSNRVKVDSLPHLIEGKTYTLSCLVTNRHSTSININSGYGINGTTWVLMGSVGVGETKRVSMTFIANSDKYGRRLLLGSTTAGSSYTVSQIQIEESSSATSYKPYKSNNTKIPLLSPLRRIPNRAYDEVILDRENHKAKIVQRVGKLVLDGSQPIFWNQFNNNSFIGNIYRVDNINETWGEKSAISDRLEYNVEYFYYANGESISTGDGTTNYLRVSLARWRLAGDTNTHWNQYLKENPITVYYELKTPVITEVDLEGFPYIYKDGHLFLNGEIAPVTEIKYSINQSHMIEASNQDLIRHQKEIDYLYKLIGEYVRVDYKNTLLSLNLELK